MTEFCYLTSLRGLLDPVLFYRLNPKTLRASPRFFVRPPVLSGWYFHKRLSLLMLYRNGDHVYFQVNRSAYELTPGSRTEWFDDGVRGRFAFYSEGALVYRCRYAPPRGWGHLDWPIFDFFEYVDAVVNRPESWRSFFSGPEPDERALESSSLPRDGPI